MEVLRNGFPIWTFLAFIFFGRILNRWNFLGGLRQDGFRGWKFFALPFLVGIF